MNTDGFESFWKAWPGNKIGGYSRKGAKSECLKRWTKHHHETQTETIVRHVEWLKTTADWLKDSGMFIPAPLVYLNQQRWDGADVPETPMASEHARTQAYLAQVGKNAAKPSAEIRARLLELSK